MNQYKAPVAEEIKLTLVNVLMTSDGDETTAPETGENQLPINPRGGNTPV